MRSRLLKNVLVGVVIAGLFTFATAAYALPQVKDNCQSLDGHVAGQLIGPTDLCNGELTEIGTFADTEGNVLGTFVACAASVTPRGNGAIMFHLLHTYFPTAGGTFTTSDHVVAQPINPPLYGVENRVDITGGTGIYQDAFGFLKTHGSVNLSTGVVSVDYHGRICTPD